MTRFGLLAIFITGIAIIGFVWMLQANVKYKPVLPRGVPKDTTEEQLAVILAQAEKYSRPDPREGSRAFVAEDTYEFDYLDPFVSAQHTFQVVNEGTAPLLLGEPKSDHSERISANVQQREIPPGKSAAVTVTFSGFEEGPYHETVVIPTSDPHRPNLQLRVRGEIVRRLEVYPPLVQFPARSLGESIEQQSVLLYSRIWSGFEVLAIASDVTENFGEISTALRPATADDLSQRNAQGGYWVDISPPAAELKSGNYAATLTIKIQPPGEIAEPTNLELPLRWKIYRPLGIYGEEIDQHGVIDLGLVRRGRGKTAKLRLKVRDRQPVLTGVRFEVQPSFVQVRLEPHETGGKAEGSYILRVEVPVDAPQSVHLTPDQWGEIRMFTDHPRIPSETLKLRLAVVDSN